MLNVILGLEIVYRRWVAQFASSALFDAAVNEASDAVLNPLVNKRLFLLNFTLRGHIRSYGGLHGENTPDGRRDGFAGGLDDGGDIVQIVFNQLNDGRFGGEFLRAVRVGITGHGEKCGVGRLAEEGLNYGATLLARYPGYKGNFFHCERRLKIAWSNVTKI